MNILSLIKTQHLAVLASVFLSTFSLTAQAETFNLPPKGNDLIGQIDLVTAEPGDTLLAIAQRNHLGVNAIMGANPGYGPVNLLAAGTHVEIPGMHIIPPLARQGIVINLPEMRLYYYPKDEPGVVLTYPIGIGRVGKTIPIARTAVISKKEHPVWIPPDDIRAFDLAELGVDLPKIMPAGPDNPLGNFAIYLKIPTYLIHATIYPDSIGTRASFGCIRMLESDIQDFFPLITPGVPVTIVDMPNKIGWLDGVLYLESHKPLEEHSHEYEASVGAIVNAISETEDSTNAFIDWQLVAYLSDSPDGVPHPIGFRIH